MGAWDETGNHSNVIQDLTITNANSTKATWTIIGTNQMGDWTNNNMPNIFGVQEGLNWKGHSLVGATGTFKFDLKGSELLLAYQYNTVSKTYDLTGDNHLGILSRFGDVNIKNASTLMMADGVILAYGSLDINADSYIQNGGTVGTLGLKGSSTSTANLHEVNITSSKSITISGTNTNVLIGSYVGDNGGVNAESAAGNITLDSPSMNFSDGAHIGNKHGNSPQTTTNLTLNGDKIEFLTGAGGEASNINVNNVNTLTISGAKGGVASHLISGDDGKLEIKGTNNSSVSLSDQGYMKGGAIDISSNSLTVVGSDSSTPAENSHIKGASVELTSNTITLNQKGWISGSSVGIKGQDNSESLKVTGDGSGSISSTGAGGITVTGGSATGNGTEGSNAGLLLENVNLNSSNSSGSTGPIKVTAAGSVVVDNSKLDAGIEGSIKIDGAGDIFIGTTTGSDDTDINKDTQILAGNVTITTANGGDNKGLTITDAVIGSPSSGTDTSTSVAINGGNGTVNIVGSQIGETTDNVGSKVETDEVTITGGTITVGSAETNSSSGSFDTTIGGGSITVGNTSTNKVTVNGAQIGTSPSEGNSGSEVTIDAGSSSTPGEIIIGDSSGGFDTSINGGSINIGAGDSVADVTINGSKGTVPGSSTTNIVGDKITVGNDGGSVSISGSNLSSSSDQYGAGITIVDGSADGKESSITDSNISSNKDVTLNGNLSISGSTVQAGVGTGSSGSVNFGGIGEANGNFTVTGGSSISGDLVAIDPDGSLSVSGESTINAGSVTVGSGADLTLGESTGDNQGSGNLNIAENGSVTVEGSLDVSNGSIAGAGDLTISTSGQGNVSVGAGSSINAGPADGNGGDLTISGDGTFEVNGGKLEANAGNSTSGTIEGGNVNITGSNVTVSGEGSITADGTLKVESDDNNKGSLAVSGESTVNAGSVTVGSGADLTLGESTGDNQGSGNLNIAENGIVTVEGSLDVDNGSIAGAGDLTISTGGQGNVSVGADSSITAGLADGNGGDLTISGDGTFEVNGGNLEANAGNSTSDTNKPGNVNITGSNVTVSNNGSITAEGTLNVEADGDNKGSLSVSGESSVNAGSVTVGSGADLTLGESTGDNQGSGNLNIAENGTVTANGSLNVNNGTIAGNGNLTISGSESGSVNVGDGGSVSASGNVNTTTGSTINLGNGSKLEAGQNGNVNVEGSINMNGTGSDANSAPVISAGGVVSVGSTDSSSGSGSINIAAGSTGTIVAQDNDKTGNNFVITNGGKVSVDSDGDKQGSLVVTNDANKGSKPSTNGGLVIDGANVSVEDGGYLASEDITFNQDDDGNAGKLVVNNGGGLYTDVDTILSNAGSEGQGNLVFNPNNDENFSATVQISGTISGEKDENGSSQLDKLKDIVGNNSTIVLDRIEGMPENSIISKDDMENQYGGAVIGDVIIDTSNNEDSSNTLTQGGGGSIMVGTTDTDGSISGTLTVKPDNNSHKGVTITGSETDADREIVVGAGSAGSDGNPVPVEDGRYDIALEDGADLTLGKDGAAGGTLSGSITATESQSGSATDGSDLTVVGGNFTIEGDVDLNNDSQTGDIVIKDQNTTNSTAENGLSVVGNVNAGNLTMGSGDTNLDVGGNLILSGDATLTGDADVDVDGSTTVTGKIDIEDNGSLSVGMNPTSSDTGDLTIDGSLTTGSGSKAEVGGNLTVGNDVDAENKDATIGGELAVGGTADINGSLTIGSSAASDGSYPNPNGSFESDGKTDVAGDVTLNSNGSLSVGMNPTGSDNGDLTIDGSLTTGSGSKAEVGGNLTVGIDGQTDKEAKIEGELAVGGEADINGSLTIGSGAASDGSYPNPNGSFESDGKTDVAGDVILNNNGSLSVGMNPTGSDTGDLTINGSLTTGAGSSATVGGDLTVGTNDSNKDSTIGGELTVGGNGTFNGNLTVGVDESPAPTPNGSVSIDGKLTVTGSANVNTNGSLTSNGETTFSGGLALKPDASFVNNSTETTTVDSGLVLDSGASITTNGSFVLGDNIGDKVGTSGNTTSGILNGSITAGDIDFSKYVNDTNGNTVTFAGVTSGSGDDLTHVGAGFETGSLKGNVKLENGANGVLAPSADGKAPTVNGFITVAAGNGTDTFGNTLTTNADNKVDYSDLKPSDGKNAVVNMDSSIVFSGESSGLVVGTMDPSFTTPTQSGIYFGADSSLVIDASNMTSGSALFDNGKGESLQIHYAGAQGTTTTVDLSGWTMGTNGSLLFGVAEGQEDNFEFISGNVLQSFDVTGGEIHMSVNSVSDVTNGTLTGDLADSVTAVMSQGGTNYVSQAYDALFTKPSTTTALDTTTDDGKQTLQNLVAAGVFDGVDFADGLPKVTDIHVTDYGVSYKDADGKTVFAMNDRGKQAAGEIATFPIAAGSFNATYDYLTEFNRAVDARALEERLAGRDHAVWAHVIATFNKSDELFGASGYSADLYGGVLGTDVKIGNDTLIGAALTVGTGDIKSRGAVIGTESDATFYGLSLYGEHALGALAVKGDVTYLRTESDITGTFEGVNMGGSLDSNAFSAGVRAEFKAYEGSFLSVTPHLGIRYTNYSFDDYEGTEIDDVNVIESPVGVAFSGKVIAEGGWTVVPELDLSVVPQLGDREATVVNAGVGVDQTVLEGALFNARIGLGIQKDNFAFGLNYQHGAGGYGRNNNAFQANARWLF